MRRSLIVFSLVVFTVSSIAYAASAEEGFMWWLDKSIAKDLNLTGDQVQNIDKIFSSYKGQIVKLDKELKQKESELQKNIRNPESDRDEILRLTEQAEQIRSELRKIKVNMFLQIRDVLSPEQRTKLRDRRTRY